MRRVRRAQRVERLRLHRSHRAHHTHRSDADVRRAVLGTGQALMTTWLNRTAQRHRLERHGPPARRGRRTSMDLPAVASSSLIGALKEIASLHSSGALTDAEFAAAKAKLLG